MTLIASGGVIIASAALFIVLSVFTGLKDFSLQFSSFVDPDIKLLPLKGKSFDFSEENMNQLKSIESLESYSLIVEERVIIKSENKIDFEFSSFYISICYLHIYLYQLDNST